ncbi:MAG: hypothetical protein C4549_02285, partial [Deltaproteobacteria bacterium]
NPSDRVESIQGNNVFKEEDSTLVINQFVKSMTLADDYQKSFNAMIAVPVGNGLHRYSAQSGPGHRPAAERATQ